MLVFGILTEDSVLPVTVFLIGDPARLIYCPWHGVYSLRLSLYVALTFLTAVGTPHLK